MGWYAGYASYFVVSIIAGAQVAKANKGTKSFAKLVDPLDADTDGDGIPDGVEKQYNEDPTLFDATPPEVGGNAEYWTTLSGKSHYSVEYSVADPSGIEEMAVLKDGDRHFQKNFDGESENLGGRTEFEIGLLDTSIDAFHRTSVDVYAEDAHGNAGQKMVYSRGNFYGHVIAETGANSIDDPRLARNAGVISGFAASLGSSADGIKGFLEDPLGFVEGVRALIALADETGLLDLLIDSFAEQFEEHQDVNNPYDEADQPHLYSEFRVSWYSGYVVGFVSELAVGAAATKVVKGTKTYTKVAGRLANTRTAAAYRTVTSPADKAKGAVAARAARANGKAGGTVVGGAKSAGKSYRLWRLARQVDGACGSVSSVGTSRTCMIRVVN